ncbi:hypothetical protein FB451DRAFT_1371011 [Mycena latifolia]|nr:hypothetical protein FB451DRAFT_1371011 [Mycena latifolia]
MLRICWNSCPLLFFCDWHPLAVNSVADIGGYVFIQSLAVSRRSWGIKSAPASLLSLSVTTMPSINITLIFYFLSFLLGEAFQALCASLFSSLKSENIRVVDAGPSVSISLETLVVVVVSVLVVHDIVIFIAERHLYSNRKAPAARKHASSLPSRRFARFKPSTVSHFKYLLAASPLAVVPPRLASSMALVLFGRPSSPVALPLVPWRVGLPDAARRARYPPQHLLVLLLRLLLLAVAARAELDVDEECFATIEELMDVEIDDVQERKMAVLVLRASKASPGSLTLLADTMGALFLAAGGSPSSCLRPRSVFKVKQPAFGVSYTAFQYLYLHLHLHLHLHFPVLAATARQLKIRCAPIFDEVRDTADALVVEAVTDSSGIEENMVDKNIKEEMDTSVKEVIGEATELEDTLVAEPASDWATVGEKIDIGEVCALEHTVIGEPVRKSANMHEKVEAVTVTQDPVPTYEECEWGAAPSYEEFADGAPPEPLFAKRLMSLTHAIHRPPSLAVLAAHTGARPSVAPRASRLPLLPPRLRCMIPSSSPPLNLPTLYRVFRPPYAVTRETTKTAREGIARRAAGSGTPGPPTRLAIAAANGPRKMLHRGRTRVRLLGPCAAAFSSGFDVFLGGEGGGWGLREWGLPAPAAWSEADERIIKIQLMGEISCEF